MKFIVMLIYLYSNINKKRSFSYNLCFNILLRLQMTHDSQYFSRIFVFLKLHLYRFRNLINNTFFEITRMFFFILK